MKPHWNGQQKPNGATSAAVAGSRPWTSRQTSSSPNMVSGGTVITISFTPSSSPKTFDIGMISRSTPRLPISAHLKLK